MVSRVMWTTELELVPAGSAIDRPSTATVRLPGAPMSLSTIGFRERIVIVEARL
jgi:hypothetical protein